MKYSSVHVNVVANMPQDMMAYFMRGRETPSMQVVR